MDAVDIFDGQTGGDAEMDDSTAVAAPDSSPRIMMAGPPGTPRLDEQGRIVHGAQAGPES